MKRKPKWKVILEEAIKTAPLLAVVAKLLHELHPYVAPWLA